MFDESRVKLAAKMYDMRDTSRRLLGERYADVMDEYGRHIQAAMKKYGCGEVDAAQKILVLLQRDCQDSEMSQMQLVAALVEMVERPKTTASRDKLLRRRAKKEAKDGQGTGLRAVRKNQRCDALWHQRSVVPRAPLDATGDRMHSNSIANLGYVAPRLRDDCRGNRGGAENQRTHGGAKIRGATQGPLSTGQGRELAGSIGVVGCDQVGFV